MSLPPSTIHIKRKATDDPVDFLSKNWSSNKIRTETDCVLIGVHELNSKRQRRASEFVFTRQSVEKDTTQSQPAPAGVRRIKELPRAGSAPSLSSPATKPLDTREGRSEAVAEQASETSTLRTTAIDSQQIPIDNASKDTILQISRQRRFHISRPSTPISGQSPVIGGRVQKRTPTVFVERRSRPTSSKGGNPLDLNTQPSLVSISSSQKDKFGLIETPLGHTVLSTTAVPAEAGQSRSQKKPGLAARTPLNGTSSIPTTPLTPSTPGRNVRLPSGLVMPWDVTSDQLAKEMQEYTLQQIGLSIAKTQTNSSTPISAPAPRKTTKSKFKPKKPAARYHERHPDQVPHGSIDVDEPYLDDDDLDDDGDYVIDTYIRMPADEVEPDKTNDFGLLVLESQPDFEEFYREDSDHDTEEEDEEEDENGTSPLGCD